MSHHLRRHYPRNPSIEPVTRAALKSIFRRQSAQAYQTLPVKKPPAKRACSIAASLRRSMRSVYSNSSRKSRRNKQNQPKSKTKLTVKQQRPKKDPITVLFSFLDRRKTGVLNARNLANNLDSTCERMIEPLLNGIRNRGQQYTKTAFREAVLEMFPYWEQSCLCKMVQQGRHVGRKGEPGSALDSLQLRQLEALLNAR